MPDAGVMQRRHFATDPVKGSITVVPFQAHATIKHRSLVTGRGSPSDKDSTGAAGSPRHIDICSARRASEATDAGGAQERVGAENPGQSTERNFDAEGQMRPDPVQRIVN